MERAARGVGVWGTRVAVGAEWVTEVDERGTAALGELGPYSVFGTTGGWLKCLESVRSVG